MVMILLKTTLLIVEDDPFWQDRIAHIIEKSDLTSQVFLAKNLGDALTIIRKHALDLMIVDLGLPDGSGLQAIRTARSLYPNCDIMVGTVFADEASVVAAICAGATGYVLKESDPPEWIAAINDLLAGHSPINPKIARHVLRAMRETFQIGQGPDDVGTPSGRDNSAPLTEREIEVLRLVSKGFTHNEVSNLLTISVETVKSHTKKIYQKLEVNSRTEAIFEAKQMGII